MVWMLATRIPVIANGELKMDPNPSQAELMKGLEPSKRWPGDNYNHLHEQPTLFYAVIVALIIMRQDNDLNLYLAWAYVGFRIIHSFIQSLTNIIVVRFAFFSLASACLIGLTINALVAFTS